MCQYIEAIKGNSFVTCWLIVLGSFGIYLKIPSCIFYIFLRGYTSMSSKGLPNTFHKTEKFKNQADNVPE